MKQCDETDASTMMNSNNCCNKKSNNASRSWGFFSSSLLPFASSSPSSINTNTASTTSRRQATSTTKTEVERARRWPIFPAHDPGELVGVITSALKWNDVMDDLFSDQVSGVDCVLDTGKQVYTWHIAGGEAVLRCEKDDPDQCEGDFHDHAYDDMGRSIPLYSPGLFEYSSANYTLSLYPSEKLFEVYSTSNPVTACVGALCIVLCTSALFILFDFFVRRECHEKEAVASARQQYVRYISHEVRTPLNAVVMGSQLVQDDMSSFFRGKSKQLQGGNYGNNTKEAVDSVIKELQTKLTDWSGLAGEIQMNTQSAVSVLNDLLNYDKVDSGSMQLELTVIPIWSLIDRTVSEFNLSATVMGIDMKQDFEDLFILPSRSHGSNGSAVDPEIGSTHGDISELPKDVQEQRVIGDTVRIAQILRCFLSNAIKFTPQGGKIIIHVSQELCYCRENDDFVLSHGDKVSYRHTGNVRIDVIDTGRGLTTEQVENLLRQGVQFNLNKLKHGQGSCLGLFISRGLAEQHGGFLSVASNGPGHGSTFSVTLPLYHVPDDSLPESLRHLRAFRGESGRLPIGTFRILVVDDVATNRKLLTRLLKHRGHVVDEAEDGRAAVDLMKEAISSGNPYRCVLLDWEMPVMDGPTAAAEMRKLGCSSYIAGVTCKVLPEEVAYFKSKGANAVLPKPLNIRDLEQAWEEFGVAAFHNNNNTEK